jgi:hypothetical protein
LELEFGELNNNQTIKMTNQNALWLVAEGDYVLLKIEVNKEWVTLIKEPKDSPFSHIIEPSGIQAKIDKINDKSK